ncbi:MAG: ResB protein required for cytochrome C biosynthesis, partial [Verrucomicrobia bacterium]|nr:ResB protein required for cytochrome C biosynthesis [Verrucomicrobiota bacterium]
MLNNIKKFFTSLKLTVTCLSLFMLIVFVGTIAQVEQGLYIVQERYFKSIFVYWGPENSDWQIPVMPGGYLVGTLLMLNLVGAFIHRFKLTKKKVGIYISHAGLILLLLGQVFTDLLTRESAMEIKEGETVSHSADFRLNELAFTDHSNPEEDKVFTLSESFLQSKAGAIIPSNPLPFKIKVIDYWPNVSLVGKPAEGYTRIEAKSGFNEVYMKPMPPATAMDERDVGTAVLDIIDGENSLGEWLVATVLDPQTFEHQGKEYSIGMRAKRYNEDFSLTLLRATHENYTGTMEPKNFASRVRLQNDNTGEDREVLIYMNHPLRYHGLTFFQHQMSANEMVRRKGLTATSTFQVVQNPTWLTPYLACTMVGVGLTTQFMVHLIGFTR